MIKAIFFDLDGTLIDTKESNFLAYQEAFSKYNIQLNRKYFFENCFGKHFSEFAPSLVGKENTEIQNKIRQKKSAIFNKFLNNGQIVKSSFKLLKENYLDKICVLVTTASMKAINDWDSIFDFKKYFRFIISGDDVKNKKPDPEAYLLALDKCKLLPEECIVIEDSATGFEAAKRARIEFLDVGERDLIDKFNNL